MPGPVGGAGAGAASGAAFGPWGAAIGAGMGLLGGLFGPKKPSLQELPENPFINQLGYKPFEMGPARKIYKGWFKDPLSQPSMGQFAQAEATAAEEARRRPSLQLGPMGDRVRQLQVERQKQQIGGQRMGYVGDMQRQAAQGLQEMWMQKNLIESQNLANAARLRQQQYSYV